MFNRRLSCYSHLDSWQRGLQGSKKSHIFSQYSLPNKMNESQSFVYDGRIKDIVKATYKAFRNKYGHQWVVCNVSQSSITNLFKDIYITFLTDTSILFFLFNSLSQLQSLPTDPEVRCNTDVKHARSQHLIFVPFVILLYRAIGLVMYNYHSLMS